jgi:hypothetical protein
VERDEIVDETAWKDVEESYLIALDPNEIEEPTSPIIDDPAESDTTVDLINGVRGICAATYWCSYLIPSKTKSKITLKFKTPMLRGAMKGKQA